MEPLLNKYYVHIAPLSIHVYGGLARPKYDEMPRERINKETHFIKQPENPGSSSFNGYSSSQQQPQQDSTKSTPQRTMNLKSPPSPTKESNWGWATLMKYLKSEPDPDGSELISPDGNSSPGRDEGSSTPEDIANEIPNGTLLIRKMHNYIYIHAEN